VTRKYNYKEKTKTNKKPSWC